MPLLLVPKHTMGNFPPLFWGHLLAKRVAHPQPEALPHCTTASLGTISQKRRRTGT